jgi:hypothetical protein
MLLVRLLETRQRAQNRALLSRVCAAVCAATGHTEAQPDSDHYLKTCPFAAPSEWRDSESNRGHYDFQSYALPTELSRRDHDPSAVEPLGAGCSGRPSDMSDDELDELILGRLRNGREQAVRVEIMVATQSPADLAASFNEAEIRIVERLLTLASEGRIKESAAAPGRWRIA